MNLTRGDVAIALFPNADGSGAKPRPIVVVQADLCNAKIKNLIVAAITTNLKHAGGAASLLIDVTTPEGKASGVIKDSVVSCINLATIDEGLIARKTGQFSTALMAKMDACLKAALGLT